MTQDTLRFAADKVGSGVSVALVSVTETHGSSPASPGQLMAVAADGETAGTVGGGISEFKLVQQATEAIKEGRQGFTFSFNHSEFGMVCGGGMAGFGTVLGAGPRLLLFGGGHVAQQVAKLALNVGFAVTVVEDRPELAADFEHVQYLVCTPDEYVQKLAVTQNTYVLIATRGHKTDDAALRFCLGKPYAYLGMIGSKRKVNTLLEALRTEGVGEDTLRGLYAPVGLDIASGAPAEIAVAIVGEMLLVKNGGNPGHKKLLP